MEPARQPSPRVRPLRLALGCALGFALLYLLAVQTHAGRQADEAALRLHPEIAELDPTEVDVVGPLPFVLALVVFAVVAFAHRGWRPGLAVAGFMLLAGALGVGLGRVLPQVNPDPSFPSGHTTLAMAIAAGLVLVAAPAWRRAMVACATVLALAAGIGVVIIGWHRPAEAAAGFLVAIFCAALLEPWIAGAPRRDRAADGSPTAASVERVALWLAGAVALAGAVWGLAGALDGGALDDLAVFLLSVALLAALAYGLLSGLEGATEPR